MSVSDAKAEERLFGAFAPWCWCTWGAWVRSVRAGACMHEVMFWILKRNDSDEDMDVRQQQYGARADKKALRRSGMTEALCE
jgi:hypothetical protein